VEKDDMEDSKNDVDAKEVKSVENELNNNEDKVHSVAEKSLVEETTDIRSFFIRKK
jgi:hypothetical protein